MALPSTAHADRKVKRIYWRECWGLKPLAPAFLLGAKGCPSVPVGCGAAVVHSGGVLCAGRLCSGHASMCSFPPHIVHEVG